MAFAGQIHMCHTVGIFQFAVACKPIQDQCESLVAFHIAGALEEFVEHRADQVLCRRDKTRRSRLVRKLPADQAIVIREVDIHFHV